LERLLAGLEARPLSHSLLLRKERFTRKEWRGFFAGILTEQNKRELVARNLGISPKNDFSMLERIGGEYLLDNISPSHFEGLAEDTGLAKPLVRERVLEFATIVAKRLKTVEMNQPDVMKIAQIIRERSEYVISGFKK
jgi:hypothetical protein